MAKSYRGSANYASPCIYTPCDTHSLDPPDSASRMHLDWFSRLCTAHGRQSLYCTTCVKMRLTRDYKTSHTHAAPGYGSREITAAASRGLAAGQSSGESPSSVRSESGAPLPPKQPQSRTAAACLASSQHRTALALSTDRLNVCRQT